MKLFKIIRSLITLLARTYLYSIASLILWIIIPLVLVWTPTAVISGSMEPSIMTGDVLSAQKVTEAQVRGGAIKEGMVVLATDPMKPETLYTHRVIEVFPDKSMITKGDANASPDPMTLPPENVRGIERLRIPFIGLPAQAIYAGDTGKVVWMALSVILSALILGSAKTRDAQNSEVEPAPLVTKPPREKRTMPRVQITALGVINGSAATVLSIVLVALICTASAAYVGSLKQVSNSWTASSVFPSTDPKIAKCGLAVYTSTPGTTLTCAVAFVSGKSTYYTLTVKGTGALTQWSVTTDWTGVTNWLSSRAAGTGVSDTGDILTQKDYQITGLRGKGNSSDSRNHAWVSSTKAAEVFTVQVTTK